MKALNYPIFLFTAGVLCTGISHADEKLLSSAQQCTLITERLERLTCFDQLFNTPTEVATTTQLDDKPKAWHTAFKTSKGEQAMNFTQVGTEEEGDLWLTLRAKGAQQETAPILMLSCISNISRIELAMPEALEAARIRVSIAGGPAQSWRSDDLGVLFSSAQGMPAIAMMKAMTQDSRMVLRSNARQVNGLQFDTTQLKEAIKPLRERCGW